MSKVLVTCAVASVLLLALVVVGCGGGNDNGDGNGNSSPASQTSDFTDCLRKNGIEPPDPNSNQAPTFDPSKMQKALEACRDKLAQGAQSSGGQ